MTAFGDVRVDSIAAAEPLSQYGVVYDATGGAGTPWTGTDNAVALQNAVDNAPEGAVLLVEGRMLTSKIVTNRPVTFAGFGPWASQIIAHSGVTGDYLFELGDGAATEAWARESHFRWINFRDLRIDGNGRTVPMGGIKLRQLDHLHWSNVEIWHFAETGLDINETVRESEFHNVHVRFCGDATHPQASVWTDPVSTRDPSNNLHFYGCKSLYGFGTHLLLGGGTATSRVRTLDFHSLFIHGSDTATPTTATTEGWTYNDAALTTSRLLDIAGCEGANFYGGRFHEGPSDKAMMVVRQDAVQGAGTRNAVSFIGTDFGSSQAGVGAQPLLDLQHSTDTRMVGVAHSESDQLLVDEFNGEPFVYVGAQVDYRPDTVRTYGGAARDLVLSDVGRTVRCNNAPTMTVTADATTNWQGNVEIRLQRNHVSNNITVAAAAGVTIDDDGGLATSYDGQTLVLRRVAADTWTLTGVVAAGEAVVHYGHNSGAVATFVADDRVLFTELNAANNGAGVVSLNGATDTVTLAADTGVYEVTVFADTEAPAAGDATTVSVLVDGVAFTFFDVTETGNQVGAWCDLIDTAGAAKTVEVNRASVTGTGRLNVKTKVTGLG